MAIEQKRELLAVCVSSEFIGLKRERDGDSKGWSCCDVE